MKKYSLSISIPVNRSLEQEAALDAILSRPDRLMFSRTTRILEEGGVLERYEIILINN